MSFPLALDFRVLLILRGLARLYVCEKSSAYFRVLVGYASLTRGLASRVGKSVDAFEPPLSWF